jgi:Holliday junction DNA helicase RuvA
LLELQGKFVATGSVTVQGASSTSSNNDIVNALQALGYNEKEADWAAKQLPKDATVSDGIRQALKLLSKT